MKLFFPYFLLPLFFFTCSLSAQSYQQGIGTRLGAERGVTFKQFVSERLAWDQLLLYRPNGMGFASMMQHHFGPSETPQLQFLIGLGVHYGFREEVLEQNAVKISNGGMNAAIGFEYHFPKTPFLVGMDIRPRVDFMDSNQLVVNNPGFSIRWIFNKKKKLLQPTAEKDAAISNVEL